MPSFLEAEHTLLADLSEYTHYESYDLTDNYLVAHTLDSVFSNSFTSIEKSEAW